jgi:hypothetical protein
MTISRSQRQYLKKVIAKAAASMKALASQRNDEKLSMKISKKSETGAINNINKAAI